MTFCLKHQGVFEKHQGVLKKVPEVFFICLHQCICLVMLEDDRFSCYIRKILFCFRTSGSSDLLILSGLPMKFRGEVPFVVMVFGDSVIVICPVPETGTSLGNFILSAWFSISLKFLKKIFGFCFSLLYIIIRCSFSFL